jgi:putative sugar O-methyltransferase
MGEIIERARRFRAEVRQRKVAPLTASQLWEGSHEEMHTKAIEAIEDEPAFIEFLTANNAFTFPRLTDDPQCVPIADAYLDYLARQGTPLPALPSEIAESALVSGRTILQRAGRPVSTMFLLHLCVALRLRGHTEDLRTIIEIGGGYGNLARIMRLFYPEQKYVIVDLLDSLYCSYVFLAVHFPDRRMLFVTEPAQLASMDEYDFVFVPSECFDGLRGCKVDLIVNTCSLGEMPQSTVDRYMKFVNGECSARYFYSINRFGPFSAEYVMPDQAGVSVKLAPNWRITVWDAFGERGFSQIEPVAPAYLELLAERTVADEISHEGMSALLAAMAGGLKRNSSAWHYCMWNAIRLFPSKPLIREYLKVIEPLVFRDVSYYRELYVSARPKSPALPVAVDECRAGSDVAIVAPSPDIQAPAATLEADELRAELEKVYSSRSWRITRPLRMMHARFQKRIA